MVAFPALLDRLNWWWDWLSHTEVLMATSTVLVLFRSWVVTLTLLRCPPSLTVPLHTRVLCRGERGIKLTQVHCICGIREGRYSVFVWERNSKRQEMILCNTVLFEAHFYCYCSFQVACLSGTEVVHLSILPSYMVCL